ncbi:hypothetical protein HOV93_49510 [Planctomycetes bacterium FF15]|uniref:Uncharacterized protein n=1 Tax=Bremerella alba TaxID=980252 RepID=A0A7V8VA29_9BACT|nr:hypothetical protein [Bremerella alba]
MSRQLFLCIGYATGAILLLPAVTILAVLVFEGNQTMGGCAAKKRSQGTPLFPILLVSRVS